jgi:phosphoribosylformylglycinamidine synthase
MVMGDTVQRPGGDSAIVRLHGSNRGLAITTDCTPRYCAAAPETGGRQAAAEAWRNLIAVGATPLALTNNLNFGNPERPEIMGQFVECVKGISAAATALDFPVVSGNVSLYNETNGEAILPTPVIGGLGLIDDIDQTVAVGFTDVAQGVILIGDTTGWLGASAYLKTIEGRDEGAPPPVEFEVEKRNGIFIRDLIRDGAITACHDISDGGVLVAVAEMAMAGNIGASVNSSGKTPLLAWLFGEDQARYVVTTKDSEAIVSAAKMHGVPATIIGRTGGVALTVDDTHTISVKALQESHEYWLPNYMAAL